MTHRLGRLSVLCFIAIFLTGCAATGTMISKRDLSVETKMSNTVFLEPVTASKKTIFIQIRNTSDKPDFDINNEVTQALIAKGYQIIDDPDMAYYLLQANILQVGKIDPTAAEQAFLSGYGDAATGAALGGALGGAVIGNSLGYGILGAAVGGMGTIVADSLVKDVYFSVITDLQISEQVKDGQAVVNRSKHSLDQGISGGTVSMTENISNRQRYQTRILSSANKANLEWEEAAPDLVSGLVRSMSGMF